MRWLVIVAAIAGCTSYRSSYHPTRVSTGELVWAYDDRFQVTQDGRIVAEQRDWDGLPSAVACVPRARDAAESAASRDRTGKVSAWTGVAIMLGSLAVGSALIFRDTSNTDEILLGGGVAIGGLVLGLIPTTVGLTLRARADTSAIDAVNMYNDERGSCRLGPAAAR